MTELILGAIGLAGVLGFFIGRRGGAPREHQSNIASLAALTREDRTKILNMPAISQSSLPQAVEATGALIPTLPLFTNDEKIAILKEVRDYQMSELGKGHFFTQAQLVTADEIALKPPLMPTTIMAGPRFPVLNLRG